MRKKIPCRVVGSSPLSISNDAVFQNAALLFCGEYNQIRKYTAQSGATIYTSNLAISNISENDGLRASYLDMYF